MRFRDISFERFLKSSSSTEFPRILSKMFECVPFEHQDICSNRRSMLAELESQTSGDSLIGISQYPTCTVMLLARISVLFGNTRYPLVLS